MTKTYRQAQILKLIRAQPIRTQEELSTALAKSGIEVTQVTLSRDIRQLGLVKGANGYQEPAEAASSAGQMATALKRAVEEYVREVKTAQNLVIIKTVRGTAAPMADALDRERWAEITGTIAGEDTVFAAATDVRQARKVKDRLLALLR
ncbi:MAG: ArgR family transcriptional regulator [Acidobacteria bacterium]|nr:ArgR family transcriptional regulator [Acidobacteriota bacterium]